MNIALKAAVCMAAPSVPVLLFLAGPHQFSDWFWRPQFVQACVAGAHGRMDDEVLRLCNDGYWKRVAVQARGWRPTP